MIDIKLKRCCMDCEDFDIGIDEVMEYETYGGKTKCCDIICNHSLVCKRYIDDSDETISKYLNWEIGESNE